MYNIMSTESHPILNVSNPIKVRENANTYLGKNIPLYLSTKKDKKYMVRDPDGKLIHFGSILYEDFTRHEDETRKQNYLKRTANIKGDWKDNKYSANNLARNILWK
jgi:Uma2 family endonuclease